MKTKYHQLHLTKFLTAISMMLLYSTQAYSDVAKAITVRGEVLAQIDGESLQLNEGDWVPEGASITTGQRSFVKFIFSDRTQMNVAPNSEIIIEHFSQDQEEPGMINLARGRIRSQVTRNYMENQEGDKNSKLFIKTENAAMGIRGTDFVVSYNPQSRQTGLLTISGSVAFARLPDNHRETLRDARSLDRQLNSRQAQRVLRGQMSVINANSQAPTPPREVPAEQIQRLNQSEALSLENTQAEQAQSSGRIPPMVDQESFNAAPAEDEQGRSIASEESQNFDDTPSPDNFSQGIADNHRADIQEQILNDVRDDQDEFLREREDEIIRENRTRVFFEFRNAD